ncbi:2-polyprenyl-6-methoxyphenol hydroxylase-like oxidoreductase [Pycnococcus provasolii]
MLLPRGRYYKARLNSSNRSFVPHYPSHYRYPSITTPRQILFLALCGGSDGVTRESREDVELNNNLSNRENVVVVGASLAGLLVAVAFARAGYYAKVIEKDDDEEDGCSNSNSNNNIDIDNGQRTALARLRRTRAGTPQARHVHTLLAGGACALDDLLPGIVREIEHQHAVKADLTKIFHVNVDGQWLPSSDEGVRSDTVLCSRPLLEATVRSRVLQMPGISIESGCKATSLIIENGAATGITVRSSKRRGGSTRDIKASLVIDASGRGSRFARWIGDAAACGNISADVPQLEILDVGITEATLLMKPPDDMPKAAASAAMERIFAKSSEDVAWHRRAVLRCEHSPEKGRRYGLLYPVESNLWLVCLAGVNGERPPSDLDGFFEYARSLPDPLIGDLVCAAEAVQQRAARISSTRNQRRRWESVDRPVPGYLAFGDALCAPNPIYGQGVSMAAISARAIGAHLTGAGGTLVFNAETCRCMHGVLARSVDGAWIRATSFDRSRMGGVTLLDRYLTACSRAGLVDRTVRWQVDRAFSLLEPLRTLWLSPQVVARVLAAELRR